MKTIELGDVERKDWVAWKYITGKYLLEYDTVIRKDFGFFATFARCSLSFYNKKKNKKLSLLSPALADPFQTKFSIVLSLL